MGEDDPEVRAQSTPKRHRPAGLPRGLHKSQNGRGSDPTQDHPEGDQRPGLRRQQEDTHQSHEQKAPYQQGPRPYPDRPHDPRTRNPSTPSAGTPRQGDTGPARNPARHSNSSRYRPPNPPLQPLQRRHRHIFQKRPPPDPAGQDDPGGHRIRRAGPAGNPPSTGAGDRRTGHGKISTAPTPWT